MARSLVVTALAAALLGAGMVAAQTLDPDALLDQIDGQMSNEEKLLELLGDANPARARLAMEGMLASGDPAAARLALGFGLNSADPVLQRIALDGFFATGPSLHVSFDASALEKLANFESDIKQLDGSVDDARQGFAVLTVGAFSEAENCYHWADSQDCGIRLTDAGASIRFRGYWYEMTLHDDGTLRGISNMYYTKEPVPFVMPVAL